MRATHAIVITCLAGAMWACPDPASTVPFDEDSADAPCEPGAIEMEACSLGQTQGQQPCIIGTRYEELCEPGVDGAATRTGTCHLDPEDERPVPVCEPAGVCTHGAKRDCETGCTSPDPGCSRGTRALAMQCVFGVWVSLHLCQIGTNGVGEMDCGPLRDEPNPPRSIVEASGEGDDIIIQTPCQFDATTCPPSRANGDQLEFDRPCGCNGRGLKRWACIGGKLEPIGACREAQPCLADDARMERE